MNWPDVTVAALLVVNSLVVAFAAMRAHQAKVIATEVRRQTKRENLIRTLRVSRYMDRQDKGTKHERTHCHR